MSGAAPELAVVVLAVGEAPHLAAAIASLESQSTPVEIVVVRTAGGTASIPPGVRTAAGAREPAAVLPAHIG